MLVVRLMLTINLEHNNYILNTAVDRLCMQLNVLSVHLMCLKLICMLCTCLGGLYIVPPDPGPDVCYKIIQIHLCFRNSVVLVYING